MRIVSTIFTCFAAALFATAALPGVAAAGYPEAPVRLIIPFAPGGTTDIVGRLIANALSKQLNGQVVPENRGGAGATIGIAAVAKAEPNGYNMLLGNVALTSAPGLYKELPFDPVKDFTGAAIVGRGPYILAVNPSFPAKSVKELVELAHANPGKYTYASAGSGSAIHLAGELFQDMAKIKLIHVPFRGAAPASTAVIGGQVDIMFGSLLEMQPLVKAGKIRALAITSPQRSKFAPDLPTVQESGLPGYQMMGWFGVFFPTGTPANIVDKVHDAIEKALESKDVQDQLANQGLDPVPGTAAQATELVKTETAEWTKIIRKAGITAQ